MFARSLVFASLASLAACASGGASAAEQTADQPRSTARGSQDIITREQLADPSLGDADALSVVKRLRPSFLVYRGAVSVNNKEGGTVHVAVDNGPLTSVDALTTMRASEIVEIRYLSPSAAAQRYGTMAMAGPVILVQRR